ncbi:tRNA (adenosine(37)-N6)-threonylcarbamoyltransferase complex ATPase subunit type 1 TsaE [Patescibacteria group bacterium]|nr:tRNA (adenosine(37)-N6)-threonylcarbamoyltransferase complex ATPase subunit type 1 TsaE [Patescibacteria group bacterium]
MEVLTHSPRETQKLGEKISADLKLGDILALYGELGSGKTTFIQGLARGLGIKKRVISPTFVFIRQYPVAGHRSPVTFYHVDLYRINEVTEAKGLGLEEIFADPGAIVVIEWADRIKEIFT